MNKHQRLRQLHVKKLAELLVTHVNYTGFPYNIPENDNFDYDYDMNDEYWTFRRLDGREGGKYMTEYDAIQACINYLNLNEQYKDEGDNNDKP